MRKILTLLLSCLCTGAVAQNITVSDLATDIEAGSLAIRLRIEASGMQVNCNGERILEFAVESADHRLVLPVVVYTGANRYRYERRRELLSESYHIAPYHIFKGIRKNRTYELDYALSIPYYGWMEHAAIALREYTRDCSGNRLTGEGVVTGDLNPAPPAPPVPEVWAPDPALFPHLVAFLVPEVEAVKARASMIELPIGFPVNVTEVRPDFANNRYELQRADSLVRMLEGNDLIQINAVYIRGYASPEGNYTSNERLAKGRSESFKRYLAATRPDNTYLQNAVTSWVPEDWEGFERLVKASELYRKEEVLAIIGNGSLTPDMKERRLQQFTPWSSVYKPILYEMFPRLRRIELRVDYTIHKLDDSKARELLYTMPGMLSLDEIYRVAQYYEPGSKQYREVYEIAARQYPDDRIANNNAAAALLQEGNADAALPYLEKSGNPINYGAYHYVKGDPDKAKEYFDKAKEQGIERADYNLQLIAR